MRNITNDSRWFGQDSNRIWPEYKSECYRYTNPLDAILYEHIFVDVRLIYGKALDIYY
jgi:hypothetical protein